MKGPFYRILFLATIACATLASASETRITGVADVIDGDTLSIGAVIVRLNGIDAPEAGQTCVDEAGRSWNCGTEATTRLAAIADGNEITCLALDRDAYGRVIASCKAGDGLDFGEILVREGLAWAYRRFTVVYGADEDTAKLDRLGIWSAENELPETFRADRWQRAADLSPVSGCPIKGNIAQDGEHIYHTPWSPHYARTKINTSYGERWFCDEAEAQAAGWRPARWH